MKHDSPKRTGLPVHYRIRAIHPEAHLFEVTLTVENPDPLGQKLSLPVWVPGSYLVREFARHIVQIQAYDAGKRTKVGLEKTDKSSWLARPVQGSLVVTYTLYAWDASVRAAHLDTTHGFFNGTSVFLRVHGQEPSTHGLLIERPKGKQYADWKVATSLLENGAPRHGFGEYVAESYDTLVDHPVEMGIFQLAAFKAGGVVHEIAITGRVPNLDTRRICQDLEKLCEAQIRMFEPQTHRPPFKRYVFLLSVQTEGYGGLEHRNSTALICARESLPSKSVPVRAQAYTTLLGLISHEYFHSWNVKRIKPASFAPYDFTRENYTSLLWIFEGFTSYYDDLFLVRTGLISEEKYLQILATTYAEVQQGSGRSKQSVAESSFDAWIKYYRQDENASNAVVSYYKKGAIIGLALDLTIRSESRGRKSLDDVMRGLWVRFGREFYPENARGLKEGEFARVVLESTGVNVKRQVRDWAYGTIDPPLGRLFESFGVILACVKAEPNSGGLRAAEPVLGAKLTVDGSMVRIFAVYDDGAAQRCGLSAGDMIVAVDRLRVNSGNLEGLLARYPPGGMLVVHVFRRDELLEFDLQLGQIPALQWDLSTKPAPNRQRKAWLR